jgi:Bax protein
MLESGAAGNTRQSNNPFGIECRQDCSPPHSLMSFASQQAAVAYYTRLLNTGAAYQRFRELRAQLRSKNRQLRAEQLAAGLSVYAGRAKGYIQKIRTTITTHQLAKLDQA